MRVEVVSISVLEIHSLNWLTELQSCWTPVNVTWLLCTYVTHPAQHMKRAREAAWKRNFIAANNELESLTKTDGASHICGLYCCLSFWRDASEWHLTAGMTDGRCSSICWPLRAHATSVRLPTIPRDASERPLELWFISISHLSLVGQWCIRSYSMSIMSRTTVKHCPF